MSIQKTLNIYSYIVIIMLICTATTVLYMWKQFSMLEVFKNNQRILLEICVEFQEGSRNLTNFAREYVVTGEDSYKKQYFDILLVRTGKKARPDNAEVAGGEKISLLALLQQYGVLPDELETFGLSERLSDMLAEDEIKAINMVQGIFQDEQGKYTIYKDPDYENARTIVFSPTYQWNKAEILNVAQMFSKKILVRTNADVAAANNHFRNAVFYVSIFIAIIFISVLYSSWYAIKRISKPLMLTMDFAKKIDNEKFTCTIDCRNTDEISQLGKILNILEKNIKEYTERLERLSYCDDLTGLWNRRKLISLMEGRLQILREQGGTLAFAMFDIDHFKDINDTYGHDAGDTVLRTLAQTLSQCLRRDTILARFGGEEFILCFENTDCEEAVLLCDAVRKRCEALRIAYGKYSLSVTVSIGLCFYDVSKQEALAIDIDVLLKKADTALYQAKKAGRNRVMLWQPPASVA
ncbi:MAG: GGDEF domain-containing protein [Desulfovibrionaceae bacterium]|nr:GGDEF domain-containing protein [Desulfovibrionaceae bacterium]